MGLLGHGAATRPGAVARRNGRALLFISHDPDFVARHASRVLHLRGGEIVANGPADEVLRHPDLQGQDLMAARTLPALCRALNLPVCAHLDAFEQQWRERFR